VIRSRLVPLIAASLAVAALTGCAAAHAPAPHTTPRALGTHAASPHPTPSSSASAPASSAPSAGGTAAGNTLGSAGTADVQSSIQSGNTAALQPRFADQVRIVSSDGEDDTVAAADAAAATDAVESDTSVTWTWSLPAATLARLRTTPFAQFFPSDGIVGESSAGEIIAFTVVGDRITTVLMSESESALES
jgi:hypothetical protein